MATYKILCAFIITIAASLAANLQCGANEGPVDCPRDCASDYCPKSRHHDGAPCPEPAECPAPRCKCNFNHRRAENGTCIPATECPPFECSGVNEVYDSCPPLCPSQRCSDASPSDECPFLLLLVIPCSPACRCVPHHWRRDGTCVPFYDCPNFNSKLGGAETATGGS